jgi:predicted dehydrogenase
MTKPTIAVFGCGYWGQNLVRNFNQLGVLQIVCDPSEEGRLRSRQIAPEVETTGSFEDVFNRKDIQAVVLATPAETHHPLVLRALAVGMDVFVEKPLALNFHQGTEMHRLDLSAKRILMVGHVLEYHPAVLKLCELVAQHDLGKINYIYSHRLNFGKIRTEENALWSFAPHDIAIILRMVGELPIEVTCVGGSYITPNLADVTVSCLHFRTGLRAHIFVNWLNPFKEQKLVVMGSRKMGVFNDVSKDQKLVIYDQHVEMSRHQPVLRKGEIEIIPVSTDEPLRRECEHFLECIRTRETPLTDSMSGINVLKVLEACQISLQLNGRPAVLSEA